MFFFSPGAFDPSCVCFIIYIYCNIQSCVVYIKAYYCCLVSQLAEKNDCNHVGKTQRKTNSKTNQNRFLGERKSAVGEGVSDVVLQPHHPRGEVWVILGCWGSLCSLPALQVTLTAETDCSYVTWPRRRLYLLLRKDRYVARLFSSHLGYDISEKLYSLNEKLFAKFGLRFDIRLPSLYHVLGPAASEGEPEEAEELPPTPPPAHGPAAASEAPPQPPPPPPPPAPRPRASRPESDLLGEDSTSLVLEDFAELPGSFMDYVSEGEYMK